MRVEHLNPKQPPFIYFPNRLHSFGLRLSATCRTLTAEIGSHRAQGARVRSGTDVGPYGSRGGMGSTSSPSEDNSAFRNSLDWNQRRLLVRTGTRPKPYFDSLLSLDRYFRLRQYICSVLRPLYRALSPHSGSCSGVGTSLVHNTQRCFKYSAAREA